MGAGKRHRNSGASLGGAHAKVAKISHCPNSAVAGASLAQQYSDQAQTAVETDPQGDEQEGNNDILLSLFYTSDEPKWLKQINGFASMSQNRVASCDTKLIRRDEIRCTFWAEMDEISKENSSLAFELFDRYGRLNREYREHEVLKGSGVWGHELDDGDILVIETINIEPRCRHHDVGTKLVQGILGKARRKSRSFFAFANPMRLALDPSRDDEELDSSAIREQSKELTFLFRSLGFRRVGTSEWLAFTNDKDHPSRQLAEAQDWDGPEQSGQETTPEVPEPIRNIWSSLSDPSISGVDCINQLEEVFSVEENAPLLMHVDEAGNTILHVAAIGRKAEPVSYLMSQNPHLAERRNFKGYTPLEALQSNLEDQRRWRVVLGDSFAGFCQSDTARLATLAGTEIFDLTKLSDRTISAISSATDEVARRTPEANLIRSTLRLKHGCTCGQCIGGFLSPRMRFALLSEAETQYDILRIFPRPDPDGADWVTLNDDVLHYLPRAVRENLKTNKSMREGFINMCSHFAGCLRKKYLPDTMTVLKFFEEEVSEWPPATKNYLQRGGTVAAVALMLFDRVIDRDEWAGDGTLMELFEDKVNQLPICRNDHEFYFVSRMCGYERI
ncbi:hypothetical protein F5B22DRAFT_598604 [Xylaria bambusicola]|uniref:uncharacterized protein n=1 Tax=Xylaria bambusicola TaxID=326684 RepID=UPI0020078C3C|nr:uncharacterized protein F5B22DRAFT_598604 [Xylaria bambusicola]KAI0520845.1 hypothetical protein F5B22DRAFT_598604 [Xylaria bambusicola]